MYVTIAHYTCYERSTASFEKHCKLYNCLYVIQFYDVFNIYFTIRIESVSVEINACVEFAQ